MQNETFADDVEQYRSLRRRAVRRDLQAEEIAAYVDARTYASRSVLTEQRALLSHGQQIRTQARALVHLPITLHLGEWETDTFIHDLSQGGCSVLLSRVPSIDYFPFHLFLAGGITIRGYGEIVASRARGTRFHLNLRFRRMSEEALALIEDVVLDALVGY